MKSSCDQHLEQTRNALSCFSTHLHAETMFTGNVFDNRELRVKILQNGRCDESPTHFKMIVLVCELMI